MLHLSTRLVPTRLARLLPWLVLGASLIVTYSLWRDSQLSTQQLHDIEFATQTKDIHALIARRLATYEQVLRGAAGLFAASQHVDRGEFRTYVAHQNLKEHYPGIQGVGFSLVVPAADKARHIASIRREGFPDYTIRPEGTRDTYTSIIYLEPFTDRNLRAFGYDMYSEPVRRAAMEQARDTGQTTISGKVTLVQETQHNLQAGFLMYLPVYRPGSVHDTPAERRAQLVGWVYEPFRMGDLMLGVLGPLTERLDIAIYDGEDITPEHLMYRSATERPEIPTYRSQRDFIFGGHPWTVVIASRPEFTQTPHGKAHIIAVAGSGLSLSLCLLTWSLVRGRAHAIHYAETMNRELRKSEAGFRTLFERAPAGVLSVHGETGRILSANPKIAEMLGYSLEELLTMTVFDLTHPEDIPESRASLDGFVQGTLDNSHLEKRYLRKNGQALWVDLFATAIRDAQSRAIDIIGIVTDIDERKRWLAALLESEQRFHSLFTDSQVAMLLIDPTEGGIVDANRAACAYYGYPYEQLLTLGIGDINLAAPDTATSEEAQQALRNHFEFRHRLANGDIRDVEVHSGQVAVSGQTLLYSIVHDITDRKRAEERLRQLSTVVEQGPASVVITDKNGDILYANPRFTDITGYDTAEILGRNPRLLQSGLTPKSRYDELWATVTAGGVWHGELINKKKNGDIYWEEAYISPVRDAVGEIDFYAAIKLDISKRKRMEEELLLAASVFQLSGEGIVITDADNHILAANPAFTRLTGYALEEVVGQNPRMLSSGHQDQAFYHNMWQTLRSEGHWQGEIWNRRKNGELFAEWLTINAIYGEDGEVCRYIAVFSDITEKKRSDEIIWEQANFDALTNLPNRRLFRDRLGQEIKKAQRTGSHLGLLFIDLDHFKEVNDSLGHDFGDRLLVAVARRLVECVRGSDTVARLGGDEFTVILPQLACPTQVEPIAQHLVQALTQPFTLGEEMVYISASIGITVYPTDATEIEDILKHADQAMYVAKSLGRNGFSYFTPSMRQSARERLRLGNDLRQALAAQQLQVHFQPIVDLRSGRIVKAEALVRWQHPERGLVNPDQFIPLAEENGLIHTLGDWVFKEAAHWAKHWHDRGWPLRIGFNKSPVQFIAATDHSDWESHLQRIDLPGSALTVEITEGLLLKDRPEVAEKLRRLRAAGLAIAIDDFGTGYSSLAYLKRFDIDYLKIDRSFVRDLETDPEDLALAEAIIVMAHKLGLEVIAEGVETPGQRDLLLAAGCDYGQGYLYARPMPPEEFDALLAKTLPPQRKAG